MEFKYENTAQTFPNELFETAKKLDKYILKLRKISRDNKYASPESAITLAKDKSIIETVKKSGNKLLLPELKYIVVIGMGGSVLGTKAIYNAIFGQTEILEPLRYPKMLFLDTTDPVYFKKLINLVKTHIFYPEEILFILISKSGTTTESISNFNELRKKVNYINHRSLIISEKDSPLQKAAKEENIPTIDIPKKVSGRNSVFSAVGLLPLYISNVDIELLLKGAQQMLKIGLQSNIKKNLPALSAICLYQNYIKGKTTHDTFLFSNRLETLGKWYRQLLSESIGKEGRGINANISIGPEDLHSTIQLYLGGIKDKYFTIVDIEKFESDNTDQETLTKNIVQSIKNAFKNHGIPYSEVSLKKVDEESLGKFIQFKMMEVMYLANLMGVNAFDQPNVEDYKKELRELL